MWGDHFNIFTPSSHKGTEEQCFTSTQVLCQQCVQQVHLSSWMLQLTGSDDPSTYQTETVVYVTNCSSVLVPLAKQRCCRTIYTNKFCRLGTGYCIYTWLSQDRCKPGSTQLSQDGCESGSTWLSKDECEPGSTQLPRMDASLAQLGCPRMDASQAQPGCPRMDVSQAQLGCPRMDASQDKLGCQRMDAGQAQLGCPRMDAS